MLKRNYHTHLALCNHASGMTEDYALKAIEEGFVEIGISDHAPLPMLNASMDEIKKLHLDENMTLDEFNNVYIPDVLNVNNKYKNLSVKLGIETEYIKEYHGFYKDLRDKLEYMILGQHFFMKDGKLIDVYDNLSADNVINYANSIKEALDTKMFSILAHPDLYMYDYENKKFDDVAAKAADIILKACEENDVLVEININGMKKVLENGEYRYPKAEFFEIAKQYNVKFILGIDAHDPEYYNKDNIKKGIDFCFKLGIKAINME